MANLHARDNPFPSILMVEGDPEDLEANPAAGQRRLAVGADHLLYLVDDAGVKTAVGDAAALAAHTGDTVDAHDASAISFTPNGSIAATDVQTAIQEVRDEAGSGSVATDAIWDAAGDTVYGTGANTGVRLAAGSAGKLYQMNSGATAPEWGSWAPQRAVLGSQHAIASATATEVTGLQITLVAGTYKFRYSLIVQSTATTVGFMFALNYTGTVTKLVALIKWPDGGTTAATGTVTTESNDGLGRVVAQNMTRTEATTTGNLNTGTGGVLAANVNLYLEIEGIVIVSDGGDLELWHGSEVATQTSVEVGSIVQVDRFA
jgi:hypothetical protein